MNPLIFLMQWWVVMALVMMSLWQYQNKHQNAAIADVGWSYGLVGAAIYCSIVGHGDEVRRFLLGLFVSIWGIRLGTYLWIDRVLRAKEEDSRYQNLRKHFGDRAKRKFFWFFQGQALFVIIFSIPFLVVCWNPKPSFTYLDYLGIMIWLLGNMGEWFSDYQLAQFRSDSENKGKVFQKGLWRFSRHPNYFFEWIHWWSYVVFSIGASLWWISLMGPVCMGYLLMRLTGIPYAESQALKSRGDAYRIYQESTNAFIPWFPKENSR